MLDIRNQSGRQILWRPTQCVQHVPALFARGRKHRPDDRAVGGPGTATEAAGDLLLHLFGPYGLFRQIIGGRNPGINREPQDGVPMVAQTEDEIVARSLLLASRRLVDTSGGRDS